jgi:hypothetical protein
MVPAETGLGREFDHHRAMPLQTPVATGDKEMAIR